MSNYKLYPKRKAILIGCPGTNEGYLYGVEQDLKNVSKYLQSEKGGVWYLSEIKTLSNPSYDQVKRELEKANADYTFVYFSGHGYTNSDSNHRMICLRDANISDKNLLNNSPRQLVLIDACRNEISQGLGEAPEFEPQWEHITGSPVRELFDSYILNSPIGKLIVHGTQRGQYSYDSQSGGMFTNALLNISTRIQTKQEYLQVSIENLIRKVPQVLLPMGNDQRPSIVYKTGFLTVPFAVGVPNLGYQKVTRIAPKRHAVDVSNNSSGGGWLALGITLLVLGAIASNSNKRGY
jgi:hypothetical protein